MKKVILVIVLTMLALSCKESAVDLPSEAAFYFVGPQPADDSEISYIPSKYVGHYSMKNGILHVERHLIWSEQPVERQISMAELDSLRLLGKYKNGILTDGSSTVYKVTERDSTAILNYTFQDTTLAIGPETKVKRIHGSLVISRRDSIFWKMRILEKSQDTLSIRGFYNKRDYAMAQQIMKEVKANADTTIVTLNPTRKEFISILRNSKRLDGQSYLRIKG